MKTGITITGVEQVNLILTQIAPNEARNLLRSTSAEMAKQVAKDAKANVPVDKGAILAGITSARQKGTRTLIQAMAGVKRGGGKGRDPFYWRFEEYGQGNTPVAHAFFLRAAEALRSDLQARYLLIFGQKLERRLARLRKKI